jgi:predicted RNA binding protein YcfA (HicA-like mRNA interferase family)
MKVRDLITQIEYDGWRLVQTNASHRQYQRPSKPGTVTIASDPNVDIPPGTLNNILKRASVK